MTETNDGGPAFPCGEDYEIHDRGGRSRHTKGPLYHGATLRDLFAAAERSEPTNDFVERFARVVRGAYRDVPPEKLASARAAWRYLHADAMLAERERAGGEG